MLDSSMLCVSRLVSSCGLICFIAGCSVADYKKPIHDLGDALTESVMTVESIDRELAMAQNARWTALIEDNQALLQAAENECAAGTGACSLVIRLKDRSENTFPTRSVIPNALVGLSGLKSYVASLKDIVDADSAAAVATSANEALASAAEIEAAISRATVGSAGQSGTIKAYAEPSLAAIKWLVSQYEERIKLKALQTAIRRAQPVIKSLAAFHDAIGAAAATIEESAALNAFVTAQQVYDDADTKTEGAIGAYADAAATFNSTLAGAVAQPLAKFREAHTKLNDSLNGDGSVSLADAIAAIKDFRQQVDEFKTIVEDFNKVAGSHVEG